MHCLTYAPEILICSLLCTSQHAAGLLSQIVSSNAQSAHCLSPHDICTVSSSSYLQTQNPAETPARILQKTLENTLPAWYYTDRRLHKKPCRIPYRLANGFDCMGQVRAAAYGALAAYPMDLLETLEALRPLKHYAQLLVSEAHAVARVDAEILMGKALAHEHMRRRRSVTFSDRTSTACHELVDILWHAVIAGCVYERLTRTCMHGMAFAISCTAEMSSLPLGFTTQMCMSRKSSY